MATGGSDDALLKEVYTQLDQGGAMDWQYLASQFPLMITAEEISRLGKQGSPTKALVDTLRRRGLPLEEIAERCRKAGLKQASVILESCSRRIGAREGSARVKEGGSGPAVAKDSPSEQWPTEEKVYIQCVPYESLRRATNDFNDKPRSEGGYKLGQGGFGDVFYVKIAVKGKPKLECAVKRLIGGDSNEEIKKQYEAEVDTMKAFTHPHLMPLYGVSQDGPQLCIVYPFMSGSSLRAAIEEKRKTLGTIVRMSILRDVASALDYLHTEGKTPLVHRDVKSDNILLDDRNVAKLSDFGIARAFSSAGKDYTKSLPIGTQRYMAPESMRGTVSPKGDVFSLGVVLLELLVNQITFVRDLVWDLDNNYLTPESVDSLDLGWTDHQIKELLALADRMTEPSDKKRPTAKMVYTMLCSFWSADERK